MHIQFVETMSSIVMSFFRKAADDWIKKGRTVQVRHPSTPSMVPVVPWFIGLS